MIYYPGAELNNAQVMKGRVTGIVWLENNTQESSIEVAYRTSLTFGVPERDTFEDFGSARARLIELINERGDEIKADIKKAIKTIRKANEEDITKVADELTEEVSDGEEEEETEGVVK